MKRINYILLLVVFIPLWFTSCKSKEDKAAELIKTELSKTLYDFESYQPIETRISVAKAGLFNDTICWKLGGTLGYALQQVIDSREKMSDAKDHMEVWGPPSYYSSSYSDNQYYKYRSQYLDAFSEATAGMMVCQTIAEQIKDSLTKLDTTQVIGWEVFHDFRCKTRGGSPEIGHYRYIISKDFKSIILCEDRNGKTDKRTREALETITTNYWDDKYSMQKMENAHENEPQMIAKYIADNNINVKPTSSGLYIIVNKQGSGNKVRNGSTVTVDYVGRLLDGTAFDCSQEDVAKKYGIYTSQRIYEPLTYKVGEISMIKGWEEGVMGQSEGSEITLIVPSSLAYGAQGVGSDIPPYSPLVFEITILSVK